MLYFVSVGTNMRNTFLLVASLIAAASAEQLGIANAETQKLLIDVSKECIEENKYPKDYVLLVSQPYVPIEQDEKCFYDCLYRKLNVLEDKKFNKDVLRDLEKRTVDKESSKYFMTAVDRCEVTSFENCRPGYELQRCLLDFHNRFQCLDDSTRMNA